MYVAEIFKNRRISDAQSKPGLLYFGEFKPQYKRPRPAPSDKRSECNELALDLIKKYGNETTIHGLNRAFATKTSRAERLIWTVGFLIALCFLIFVSQNLAARYQRRTFKTVVNETHYPIYKIDFPEVTICNRNHLNWARFEEAKRRHLQPQHRSGEYERLFAEVLTLYDTFTYGDFERFGKLAAKPLATLNYVNFTNVVDLMAWRCHELLTECTWRQQKMNCCEIFIRRRSQLGQCLAFNSIEFLEGTPQMDLKWPWRLSENGPGNGLTVRVLINEHLHTPGANNEKGLTFMVLEPGVWFSYPMHAHIYTKTKVKMSAIGSFYDNQTKRVSSSERECVFDDERNSNDFKTLQDHLYMFENCQSECQQEHLMRFCNCTLDLFYPVGPYPPCKLVDLPCLAEHTDRLIYFEQTDEAKYVSARVKGMVCTCFLNCRSLSYLTDVRSAVLQTDERELNQSYIDMDFYFARDRIVVYKTTLIYTWVDLMVSFGGATSLFLGCSLISLVELVYFFFIEVPQRVCRRQKNVTKLKANRAVKKPSLRIITEEQNRKY